LLWKGADIERGIPSGRQLQQPVGLPDHQTSTSLDTPRGGPIFSNASGRKTIIKLIVELI